MSKKIKMISYFIIGITILGIVVWALLPKNSPQLIQEELTIEYGTELSKDVDDYIEGNEHIRKESRVLFDIEKDDFGNDAVGTHEGHVIYKDKNLSFSIIIEDTIAPIFEDDISHIDINQGDEVDFIDYFQASDLSGTTISIEHNPVDIHTPGEYVITVIAIDGHGLTATKEVTISVHEVTSPEPVVPAPTPIPEYPSTTPAPQYPSGTFAPDFTNKGPGGPCGIGSHIEWVGGQKVCVPH